VINFNYDWGQTGILYSVLMWDHFGETFTCNIEKAMGL